MKRVIAGIALSLLALTAAYSGDGDMKAAHLKPAKISKADMRGDIFSRTDTLEETRGGNTTLDVTSLLSSDKKFASGMYKSGKTRLEIDAPYGVDEFMYFIEGSVTLTSSDGTVMVINAGEAVTIPKEWTGVWDTEGYTKIWVIYSADGSGL